MEDCNIIALKSSITGHLKGHAPSTLSIPKVPKKLRKRQKDAYEPQIISFGPYHHGKPNLQGMEKYKWSFLEMILSFRPEIPWERYVEAIKEEEAKIRTCYADDFHMDSEELVEMMLIDGCFLVGYFLKFYHGFSHELDSVVRMHSLIRFDILLLENQLPFFVPIKIFDLLQFTPPSCPPSFMDLAIHYLDPEARKEKVNFKPPELLHHLLHLCHSLCLYTPQDGEGSPVSTHGEEPHPIYQPPSATVLSEEDALLIQIQEDESDSPSASVPHEAEGSLVSTDGEESNHQPPSVTTLHEAGVKFEKKEVKGGSSLDVNFIKAEGKMMIPPLVIDSSEKSRLLNLVAFEQFYPNFNELNRSFSAYVEFMDFIINTPEDVALLREHGIIRHYLGSDMNAAHFFNDLHQHVFVKEGHYLARLYKDVNDYQKKNWPKWRAMLMHNYCHSPWGVLGIVVGGILLVLAVVQTILSVYSTF